MAKQKSKAFSFIIKLLIFGVLGYGIGFAGAYFLDESTKGKLMECLTADWSYIGAGVGAFFAIVYAFLSKPKKKEDKVVSKGKTASGEEMNLSFDAKWLNPEDFASQHGLITTTWSGLPSLKNTGIIFRSVMEGGKYHIAMKDEYHCLVIGTTGSGKTSFIFVPAIRIYAHSAEKPCMVISDPKGELYTKTSKILEDEGYRIIKLDLRDPFASTCWNPMEHAYEIFHQALNFKNNIQKCSNGAKPESLGFKTIPNKKYGQEWFGFNGIAYPDEDELRFAVNSTEQVYKDLAYSELKEICSTIAPKSKNAQDPTWEEGAQDFLYGCSIAMLEDSINPELGMTKEKFNFYNLYKIATFRDPDADAPFDTLRKYLLQGRDEATSLVPSLTSAVINNALNTTKSYMGVLNGKISFMSDIGIQYLTSKSELNFDGFTDKPTAMYLVIPDDREERYPLAILCLSQLYKRLVDKANTCKNGKLPKHVYYILDEFGNLPAIPKFDSMITVSRGRNILLQMVVQSYTQIETKYGADAAKTIIGNINAQIFLGTDDRHTLEEFSKSCGEVQLYHEEKNTSKNNKDEKGGTTTSTSTQRTTRQLITAYELSQIPFGTSVVKLFRYNPMKLKGTRNDQVPFFYVKEAQPQVGILKSLDTNAVYYDIKMRNRKILKSSNPFF